MRRFCYPLSLLGALLIWGSALADTLPASARVTLPALDRVKLSMEDDKFDRKPGPYRYAVVVPLSAAQSKVLSPSSGGQWQDIKGGLKLWRGEVRAVGAHSVDVTLQPFRLPHGASLKIFSADRKISWGPYTDQDNNPAEALATPVVPGELLRLELSVPTAQLPFVRLAVRSVNHGYRGFDFSGGQVIPKAGGCETDVVCPEGNPYRDQIRAVASYTVGGGFCTGTLINNTRQDRSPLFLSANHCVDSQSDANTVVAYYNYQSAVCRQRQQGNFPPLPQNATATQSGTTVLATTRRSDVTLMRFNSAVPAAANAFWDGWDRRDIAPPSAVVIHHPLGEEKRISLENNPTTINPNRQIIQSIDLPAGASLVVQNWDVGTTEGGSSGSALLTQDTKRIVGTLSGGDALCAGPVNNGGQDYFGRLFTGWEGDGFAGARLREHLDPTGTGAAVLDGIDGAVSGSCSVSISVNSPLSAGADAIYTANISGGTGPYRLEWDVDGDGAIDRVVTNGNTLVTRYDRALSINMSVKVTGAANCNVTATRAVDVVAPDLRLTQTGAATQLCGDGDAAIEPGERWRVPNTITNSGGANAIGAYAQFTQVAPLSTAALSAPDGFGYRYVDNQSGGCGSQFVDITNLTPALQLIASSSQFAASDEGRTSSITLGANAFELYGETVNSVIMSTNGYVVANGTPGVVTGGDFRPECGVTPATDLGSSGAGDAAKKRLRVLHSDLAVATGGGLRALTQGVCDRPAEVGASPQRCIILQWNNMSFLDAQGSPVGNANFDMQAVIYPVSKQIVYQYRNNLPNAQADSAVSGLLNTNNTALNYSCRDIGRLRANRATCFFHPSAQPQVGAAAPNPLILETPGAFFGNLAVGASAVANVDVSIAANAQCFSQARLDFVAGIDERSVSTLVGQRSLTIGANGNCTTFAGCTTPASVNMRGGSFFNPVRPGNGLVSFLIPRAGQPTVFFAAWFTGEANRNPTWYIVQGDLIGNHASAPIVKVTRNLNAPGFSTTNTEVGKAQISLVDREKLLMSYQFTGGRSGGEILTHLFRGLPPGSPNQTGHYFNPAESGWGQTYESYIAGGAQKEFILSYVYDVLGQPRWVLAEDAASNESTFAVSTLQVHCPTCAWLDPNPTRQAAGSLQRVFTAPLRGTISTSFTLPAPLSGSWIRNAFPIQALSPQQ